MPQKKHPRGAQFNSMVASSLLFVPQHPFSNIKLPPTNQAHRVIPGLSYQTMDEQPATSALAEMIARGLHARQLLRSSRQKIVRVRNRRDPPWLYIHSSTGPTRHGHCSKNTNDTDSPLPRLTHLNNEARRDYSAAQQDRSAAPSASRCTLSTTANS